MNYDEYSDLVSHLRREKTPSIKSLSKHFKQPEPTVMSQIEQLCSLGCPLEVMENGDIEQVSTLDAYSLKDIYRGVILNKPINVSLFLTLDSTNSYLKSISNPDDKVLVCLADKQTQGRGRRGKSWVSPFGASLYLSIRKRVDVNPDISGCISLVIGLTIIKTLESFNFSGLKIKWPNDVYANGRKLAGVLIEVVSVKHNSIELVIGVGINVKIPDSVSSNIDQAWIDLSHLKSTPIPSRNQIAIELINQINLSLSLFESEGLKAFQRDWEKYDFLLGNVIQVIQENAVLHGTAAGISSRGELQVKDKDGMALINAGEVSVRLPQGSEE